MPESIKKSTHKVRREVGDAIEGDAIHIQCRKLTGEWDKIRGSEQHHYYSTIVKMNAYAVISRKFTNVKETS